MALFIETDAGITGVVPAGPRPRAAIERLAPLVIGEDPRCVVGIWKKLVDFVFKGGNEGQDNAAIGAIDVALWDLKAKANDEPLWRTLGARERRVKAYASGMDMPSSDDEVFAYYRGMAEMGVDAGKLKTGLDQDRDIRCLGIMKEALSAASPLPCLCIDSNEFWSPKQAIRKVIEIEKYHHLTWVEEPARRWDYRGLRKVSRGIRTAVATGENLNDIGDFMPLFANEAVDVAQVGIGTSGITGAMQVANMAYGFEIPVAMMNCPGSFMAHLAAALPNHMMMELVEAGDGPCFTADNRVEDGFICLGDSPGLGIEFDEGKLAALEVERVSQAAGPSPFGRRPGAGLWDNPPSEEEIAQARST